MMAQRRPKRGQRLTPEQRVQLALPAVTHFEQRVRELRMLLAVELVLNPEGLAVPARRAELQEATLLWSIANALFIRAAREVSGATGSVFVHE